MNDWIQCTSDWLVTESLQGTRGDRVMKYLCEQLVAGGIPLVRANVACGQLHPLFRAFGIAWTRDTGLVRDNFSFDGTSSDAWMKSPLRAVAQKPGQDLRVRLHLGEGIEEFPVLKEFRERGYTDYFCTVAAFSTPPERAMSDMDGCIATFATDAEGGFTDQHLAVIKRLFPRLALALKMYVRESTAQNLASTYLGSQAGERVLNGRIKRGDCESIRAAVWFSDMRGSTAFADRMDPQAFLNRLNRYFECTAGSVLDHGGEVLRFIGDAVLAIFPINGPGGAERAGRMAVSAARDAVQRVAEMNRTPPDSDPDPIQFGLGLHLGDVLYGNIGVPERLEFSVIGAAANETARLQDLTKTLKCTVLASDAFTAISNAEWEPMGSHRLRGVTEPQPVYSLTL